MRYGALQVVVFIGDFNAVGMVWQYLLLLHISLSLAHTEIFFGL